MLNVIICGAPGSGKGTQSDFIVKKYQLTHLSTGDILRKETASGSKFGKLIDSYTSKGELVPDELMVNILAKQIDSLPAGSKGVILDGFPRTVAQAEALEKMLAERGQKTSILVDLQVGKEELIDRLLKRGQTSGRSDDNLETITKRLEVYEEKTKPVSAYYQKLDKYTPVNGIGTLEEIFDRIDIAIKACR